MALLKSKGYDGFEVDLGEQIEDVQAEQLKVSGPELTKAANQENLTDRLFARILTNRSKSHQALMDAVPGAKTA